MNVDGKWQNMSTGVILFKVVIRSRQKDSSLPARYVTNDIWMLQSSWSCRLKLIPKMVMDMHRDYINLHYKCEKWIKMYLFHLTINSQTRKDEIVSVTSSIFILWKIHRVLTTQKPEVMKKFIYNISREKHTKRDSIRGGCSG